MKEMRKEDELKFQCVPCAYKKKKKKCIFSGSWEEESSTV